MNEITVCIIQATVAAGVAGAAFGSLIQTIKDDKVIDRKDRIIRKLRRQLDDQDRAAQDKPAPTTNNDWMRETIQPPESEADR